MNDPVQEGRCTDSATRRLIKNDYGTSHTARADRVGSIPGRGLFRHLSLYYLGLEEQEQVATGKGKRCKVHPRTGHEDPEGGVEV